MTKHHGGFGFRLHKIMTLNYVAYPQWPNNETWESDWNNMAEHLQEMSHLMKEAAKLAKRCVRWKWLKIY